MRNTKVSLTQTAYSSLRQMIIDWKLPPGAVLSEHQLAEQLQISRTPIREAILILRREGLVRNVPGESAVVTELSMREIIESFQMRSALESYAARLAAANPRSASLLGSVHEEMKRARGMVDRGEVDAYHRLSERADSLIAAAAENRYLSEALQALWVNVGRIRRVADVREARLYESVREHVEILDAILARDEDRAERASRAHLTASLNHVLRQLARIPEGGSLAVRLPAPSRRKASANGDGRRRIGR